MKTPFLSPMVVICLVALASVARAEAVREEVSPAAELFSKAMRADATGKPALRDELLHEAVRVDPDFQLARWHLGQILFQGEWHSIVEVAQLVSDDPRWQEYRLRREALDGSLQGHADLARWCRNNGLEGEEKWHWVQVLKIDEDHREALGSLGLKHYQGGLYTDEQITSLRQQAEQAEDDFKRYRKQFKRLVSLTERGTPEERAQRLSKIAAISDPAAVDALMHLVVETSGREGRLKAKLGQDQAECFVVDVCRAAIGALSNMDEHSATLKLVEISVLAPHKDVRRSAAEALRYRPPTSYMPLLMASLSAPIESSFSIDVSANGLVTLVEDFYESGPLADKKHVRSSGYSTRKTVDVPQGNVRIGKTRGQVTLRVEVPNVAQDLAQATTKANSAQLQVAAENVSRQVRNARIQEVLEIATGEELGSDPQAWWTAWQQFNELDIPDETPLYETFDEYDYVQPVYTEPTFVFSRMGSCFVAGTPVWTQSGPRPIEEIGVGDLVLSQDSITGRLDYRPVIGTTIRPPTGVVELSVEDEKIVATRGHRFWVTGDGWRMAKFLRAGENLFSGQGSVKLHDVAAVEDAPAHNLIVGEYHTYFVGNSRLLVHDNNCPLPTTATVPGAQ